MAPQTPQAPPTPPSRTASAVRWWRRPWIAPLALVTLVFLVFAVPPYLGLDPSQSRFPIREDVPWHYPMMVTHIFGGTVLMLLVVLQVWPWMRTHHPAVHRWSGRVYVFGGVVFVGIPALMIAPLSHTGPSSQIGSTLWALAWLAFTVTGYVMARRRRFADHRRWMLRSFVLLYGIAMNRLVVTGLILLMLPQVEASYGGDVGAMALDLAPASVFLSWMPALILLEWWFQRRRGPRRRPDARPAPVSV